MPMGDGSTPGRPSPRRLTVGVDVGPLHGHRTGIGYAVQGTLDALETLDDVHVEPYLLSLRARPAPGIRKLPLPAAAAHRWWRHPAPPIDRWLGRPDVVHGTNYVVPPARCPRLVSVYDCWFLDHPDDATPDVRRAADVLRRSVQTGAHVVTCSAATTARVRELLDTEAVTTVLLGPPPPHADDGSAPVETLGHPFVLSLGTVERRKNVPTLIAAFERVAREHETVHLVIAGAPGNDQAGVDRAIARLAPAIAERVLQLGIVDDTLKARLVHHAAALGYVSLDEGFGFPLLEAQQAGLPVVASTAGSIPEIAGPAALFSSPHDVDAIAANLHLAVTSPTVRSKLAAQASRNLDRFSWATTATKLTNLYHDLANGQR
jgi:glycosyltransferase involved in cell wall biosynthesis